MEIVVYSSFSKRLNSTKRPSGGTSINVYLKHPTSVITPVFILTGFDTSWNYIRWGTRYYFVRDITIMTDNQAAYSCELDVLATYKDNIGASSEYVTRAASAYNLNLIDSKYPTYAFTNVVEAVFDDLHNEINDHYSGGYGSFVMAVSNGGSVQSAGVTYYAMRTRVMQDVLEFLFGGTWINATDISIELQKELINPMQYISSIKWYPFDIPNSTKISLGSDTIKFGFWDSQITASVINVNDAVMPFADEILLPNHPQAGRGLYLNGSPFRSMSLSCYNFGQIPLDANLFVNNSSVTLGLGVDLLTGIARLSIYTGSTTPRLVHQQYGQFGVDCQVSQATQSWIEAATDVVSGSLALGAGNVLGYAGGITSGIAAIMPSLSTSGINGSKAAFIIPPRVTIKYQNQAPEDVAQFGRPLCEVRQIGSLSGYVECENVDLDIVGTSDEKRSIINYMESGFYYE